MKITSTYKKGFSLIELMVVIAIIAILTAIITSNFTQSKAKARDAKRVSDIAQLQLSLALFFDRCNRYPESDGTTAITTDLTDTDHCPSGITLGTYMSVIPTPPPGSTISYYKYVSSGLDYVIAIDLEQPSSALSDDLDGTVDIDGIDVDCDDAARWYCVKPN